MSKTAAYHLARWMPAAPGNYRVTTGRRISTIVIHITDARATRASETAAWFQNANQRSNKGKPIHVSAHYIIGRIGEVVQCVCHQHIAHHAGRANASSIGIEHVVPRGSIPTPVQYEASASLVKWLCGTLAIPLNRNHIRGHAEVDSRTAHRGCPNRVWDWPYYQLCLETADGPSFNSIINDLSV